MFGSASLVRHDHSRQSSCTQQSVHPSGRSGTIAEYVEHYHRERNHQGNKNELIAGGPPTAPVGRIRRRPRLGGLLNYYYRAAW